ncbi:hypothetical protein K458DRAFT_419240 [Lentithecium fluviatile CBS 122367]|uniref:Uncharacterized protein n=1 Tax=Lentithecium fluviatile CBS 122367 TaxID=1168545 RepID=A0A6G1IY17_9PLEO|nr:hypothetical protein K458DRAFT_419240 [Lentithecium fluviatile CBS 122367]
MQNPQQLSAFAASEGLGQCTVEGYGPHAGKKGASSDGLETTVDAMEEGGVSLPPSPTCEGSNIKKKRAPPFAGPFLHPLPTIETLMTYPTLTRPTYNSIVKGEPPAQEYNTVIRTPKPPYMRLQSSSVDTTLNQIRTRISKLKVDTGRNTQSKLRSELSIESLSDMLAEMEQSRRYRKDSMMNNDGLLVPPSPTASISSSSKATVSSSPPTSRTSSPFRSATQSTRPSTPEEDTLEMDEEPSSPAASFRTSLSTQSSIYSSYNGSEISTANSFAQSSSSSASPSPPASPLSRRPSPGDDWMSYPSPPPSPLLPHIPQQQPPGHTGQRHHFRRASTAITFHSSTTEDLTRPTILRATPQPPPSVPVNGIGEDQLGGGMLYEDPSTDDPMDWSMNGGEVILGAAGVAMSPRVMRGESCHCRCKGLGLYVIDEEGEEMLNGGR